MNALHLLWIIPLTILLSAILTMAFEFCEADHRRRHYKHEEQFEKLMKRQAQLIWLMQNITDVFHALNIRYVVFGGSLLGPVRTGSLIPFDDDLDFAVVEKDWKGSDIINQLKLRGIKVRSTILGNMEPRLYVDGGKLIDPVDIFFIKKFDSDGNAVFDKYNQALWPEINFSATDLGIPRLVKFKDFSVVIPQGSISYLLRNYGDSVFKMGSVTHIHAFEHRLHTPISFLLNSGNEQLFLSQKDIDNCPKSAAWVSHAEKTGSD